jgi:hypothetical protein
MDNLVPRHNGGFRHESVEEESSKELVQEFVAEGKRLLREELRLIRLEVRALAEEGRQRLSRDITSAKTELKQEAKKAARAGGVIGAGGILAQAALYLMLFTVVFGLATVVPLWVATLAVAVLVAGVAALMISGGISSIKRVRVTPRQTVQHLQEDKRWMKEKAHALKSTIRVSG